MVGNKAIKKLARITGLLRKSNDTPHREEGRRALREGRTGDAIMAFQTHLSIRPRDGQSWVRLGNAYKDLGLYEEAEEAYGRGCQTRPRSAHAWLQRAYLAKFKGDGERAAVYFRRSFDLDGNAAAGRELLRLSKSSDTARDAPDIIGCIDGLVAGAIFGWAVDPDRPGEPAELEFLQGGVVVGRGRTSLTRPDVVAAGFTLLHAGFRVALSSEYRADRGPVAARLDGSKRALVNSPYQPAKDDHLSLWLNRWSGLSDGSLTEVRSAMDREVDGQMLSIVMPVYNPPIDWLKQALQSVSDQFCSKWELICVDDASSNIAVSATIAEFAARDPRIKLLSLENNSGISVATNIGIECARGEYVAFMDHDDVIEPEAVYRVLEATLGGYDLIYSDEVITGPNVDDVMEIIARPAFSYDYYISHPYFVHFVAVRRSLALSVGGLDPEMSISMDVDFILRVLERAHAVAHVPVPLYRWRTHQDSAGHVSKDAVMGSTREALCRHHSRLNRNVTVSNGLTFNTFRNDFPADGRVLIIVPTKNRLDLIKPCIESLLTTTSADIVVVDHESSDIEVLRYFDGLPSRVRVLKFSGPFNFSKMNNYAVEIYGAGYSAYLFANNDIEAISSGWLEHMHGLCSREDVGVLGALLLYSDGSIQHGGVVMNVGGPAEHVYKNVPSHIGDERYPGYISGLVSVRDFMAVTGACMMVRADVFEDVKGFDPLLAVGFNDIDLCLRVRESGKKVLFDGHSVLYHHESATRMVSKQLAHPEDTELMKRRWADILSHHDPYFSPMFNSNAPAEHVISGLIDPYAATQVWRKPTDSLVARGTKTMPPEIFIL